jgi:hypothetical protein
MNYFNQICKIVHFPSEKWEICAPVPVRDLQVGSAERIPLRFSTSGDAAFIVSGSFFNSLFISRLRVFCDSLDALLWLGNGTRLASWSMARTECWNIYQRGRMFAWWCVYLLCYLLLLSLNGVLWLPLKGFEFQFRLAFRRFAADKTVDLNIWRTEYSAGWLTFLRGMKLKRKWTNFSCGNQMISNIFSFYFWKICQVWRIRVRMHPANMRNISHEIISLRPMAFPQSRISISFIPQFLIVRWGLSEKWMRSAHRSPFPSVMNVFAFLHRPKSVFTGSNQ